MTGKPSELPDLDRSEVDAWIAFAGSSQLVLSALDRWLRAEVGLSHAWYVVLALVGNRPERSLRQIDLAAISGHTEARLSYMITQLEKRGWLRREPHPTDGRTMLVLLTDDGETLLRAAAPGYAAAVRELFLTPLDAEQLAAIRDACRAVIMHLPGGAERMRNPVRPNDPE